MTPQQSAAAGAKDFVERLNDAILFPLIALLTGVALLWFVYGCAVYILNADNETARTDGKKHIMYGLIGLVIMVSAYAILSIAAGTFGLNKQLDCGANPTAPGCENIFKLPGGGSTPPGSGPGGGATTPGSGGGGSTPPGGGGGGATRPGGG